MPITSRNRLVFSFPNAIILATTAAKVLKNKPPNKNDMAKLKKGALYIVCTTVSVVTVAAMSTACAATSNAASVAALAVDNSASEAVSANTPAVRSGVNSHADAPPRDIGMKADDAILIALVDNEDRDVVVVDPALLVLSLFVLRCDDDDDVFINVSRLRALWCDERSGGVMNASVHVMEDDIAHSIAILDTRATTLAFDDVDCITQH